MQETRKKRFDRLIKESRQELKDIGIDISNNIRYEIDTRSKRRFGLCEKKSIIKISDFLFEFSDNDIKDTIIHEMLHTLKDTKGHDTKWKWYANKVNKNYPQYNISRLGSIKNLATTEDELLKVMNYKYKEVCNGCGNSSYKYKMSDYTRHLLENGGYRCRKCGCSVFSVIDLR